MFQSFVWLFPVVKIKTTKPLPSLDGRKKVDMTSKIREDPETGRTIRTYVCGALVQMCLLFACRHTSQPDPSIEVVSSAEVPSRSDEVVVHGFGILLWTSACNIHILALNIAI